MKEDEKEEMGLVGRMRGNGCQEEGRCVGYVKDLATALTHQGWHFSDFYGMFVIKIVVRQLQIEHPLTFTFIHLADAFIQSD